MSFLPENVSTYGDGVDFIIHVIVVVVGTWLILAELALIYFAVRYRKKDGRKAVYEPATSWKAMSWVLLPVVLVVICDLAIEGLGTETWETIKEHVPATDHEVQIVGKQFEWQFVHAGMDGKLGTDDDVLLPGELHVPVGTPVKFYLQSEDVIHSFFVPNLRLKQDAIPGRTIPGWFEVTKEGQFQIACAELCGIGHGKMMGTLYAHSPADYETWRAKTHEEEFGEAPPPDETPADDASSDESPTDDAAADETPTDETPAEEVTHE